MFRDIRVMGVRGKDGSWILEVNTVEAYHTRGGVGGIPDGNGLGSPTLND